MELCNERDLERGPSRVPRNGSTNGRRQGIFWLGTIPYHGFTPYPVPGSKWIKGQLELGEGGFLHWQILVAFAKKKSLAAVRDCFGPYHFELSRSSAANEYVWKDDTAVEGTRFELGTRPIDRSCATDWESIWNSAQSGDLLAIEASIRVRSYRTLRAIEADFAKPLGMERTCSVFWGPTGTGKSRRAWEEAGMDAYPKDPRTKFWCGYDGQENVIIDEFRGNIDISHLLRWLDRYPVIVEIKGASRVLRAKKIWITSNVDPRLWYPELDHLTLEALLRRLNITHFVF